MKVAVDAHALLAGHGVVLAAPAERPGRDERLAFAPGRASLTADVATVPGIRGA